MLSSVSFKARSAAELTSWRLSALRCVLQAASTLAVRVQPEAPPLPVPTPGSMAVDPVVQIPYEESLGRKAIVQNKF